MNRMHRAASKCATNVSLNAGLLAEAKALGANLSRACEAGLADAVSQQRARLWQERNAAAFDAWNSYVEDHGVPLGEFRKF